MDANKSVSITSEKKKTYIVNFTSSKAPIWLLNIIHVDQTLAVAETNKSLGLPLDRPITEISHKCIIKEAELCKLYDEKIILLTKHRYIKNTSLCTLSVTDKLWYNFLGLINNHLQRI